MFPINHKLPRLSTLCLLATVCLSSWLALGRPTTQPQPANAAIQATPPATATTTKPASRVKPISEAQLGERAIGTNPLREQVDDNLEQPNEATWRKLTLRLPKDNGKWLTVELLRSLEWIADEEAVEGESIFLDVAEMGAFGDADVISIDPCPPIQPGKGNVITGRFIHEVEQGEVIELRFAGQLEPTRVTKNHSYWSIDRANFIPAGELREGEAVGCLDGNGTTTVASLTPSDYAGLVYNGGKPRPNSFDLGGRQWGVECFFPLREFDPSEVEGVGFDDLVNWPVQCAWDDLQNDLQGLYADCDLDNQGYDLNRLLPVGTDGYSNYFCLVLDGNNAGSLVFFDHETGCVTPLAVSFSEFITGLHRLRTISGE